MSKDKQKNSKSVKKSKDIKKQNSAVSKGNKTKQADAKNKRKSYPKNIGFKLIGIILSALTTIVSLCMFLIVFDFSDPTNLKTLYLTAPLFGQILISVIFSTDFSISKKDKTNYYTFKTSTKLDTANAKKSEKESNELLVPEVDVNIRKSGDNISSLNIETFYSNELEVIDGNVYASVTKFADTIRMLESLGATDMELIKVNMFGNELFDEILSQPRTQQTLTAKEVTSYFMSKPGTYTIKKRGKLNWTFKYSFKSFGMIREGKDSYKVSIKCYPDAAAKLNAEYMALDDSNFPSGPLWYCFNELRNLPPRVVKWIVDTSFQISTLQQIKSDQLRNFKTPSDMDIDLQDIASRFRSKQTVMIYPKYTLIFTKSSKADLFTYLEKPPANIDVSQYTKEFYYKFTIADLAVSLLCGKGVSDEMAVTFIEHIEEILM